jgi:hypothetical protein
MLKSIWRSVVSFLTGPHVPEEVVARRIKAIDRMYKKSLDGPQRCYVDGGWSH